MRRVGFLVNPIAGMGGRVGLKGTDGVLPEAVAQGAEPVAPARARAFLASLSGRLARAPGPPIRWLAASREMGADALAAGGVPPSAVDVVHAAATPTSAADTIEAARNAVASGAEILVFVGGDGTARDAADAISGRIPLLGIPAGVKMHSAVFAVSPEAGAEILLAFVRGELREGEGELLDLDEEAYRRGEWRIRMHGTARTLVEPNLVQTGKLMVAEVSDEAVLGEFAEHFAEMFGREPDTIFILGPGSTTKRIAARLGLEKTLLGIDAVLGGRIVGKDLNEKGLLGLLDEGRAAKLVVSPIGAQGFILGRGNLQVSPQVLRRIGTKNVLIVATPGKLVATPFLRVDTGDPELDAEFLRREYLFVVVGYRTSQLRPVKG